MAYILREVLLNIAQLSIARQEQLVGKLLMRSIRFTYASMGEKITEIENEIFKLWFTFESEILYHIIYWSEIYQIYIPLHLLNPIWKPRKMLRRNIIRATHLSDLKKSANYRHEIWWFFHKFPEKSQTFSNFRGDLCWNYNRNFTNLFFSTRRVERGTP